MTKLQLVNELHKPVRRNFKRRRVIVKGINDLWQADLVEMGEYVKYNKGFRYLLTVIDTFSKYGWALPLKNKTATEVTRAMKNIFDKSHHPRNLQTDMGKEFYNNDFQSLMNKYKVNHYSTYSSLKASIVERFNRTLKEWMWKQFSLNGTYKWIDNLQDLIHKYNHKVHRTIKMPPSEVNNENEKELRDTVYNHIKTFPTPKFKINDKVRISKAKHIFEKGYTPNWSTEVFTIHQIKITNPVTYILKDEENKIIKGGFYEYELSKTKHPDLYLVEKVLKRKGNKVYVKWLGFKHEKNSWINKDSISL